MGRTAVFTAAGAVAQEKALKLSRYAEFYGATKALTGGQILVHSHSSPQASPCRQSTAFSLIPCNRVLDHGQKAAPIRPAAAQNASRVRAPQMDINRP
jgi:hypothetical protein